MSQDRLNGLEEALHALAASAALIDPASAPAVAALADSLAAWLTEVGPELADSAGMLATAQRVAEGLRRGFAPAEGMERLNLLFVRAQDLLAAAMGRGASPAAAPAAGPQAKGEAAFIPVSEADKDSWRDFLVEGPELLQAVETHLVGTLRHEAFDAMNVLRPLHTLKGICGMLGLEGLNRLMHACEDLLQPHKRSNSLPRSVAEAELAACDLLRSQIDAIAAGLDQGGFKILEVAPLERALESAAAGEPDPDAEPVPAPSEAEPEAESGARAADNVIRIPVAKMDSLLEAVSELAICQTQVTEGVLALGLHTSLTAEANRLDKISRALQQVVLSLRMVPVAPLFTRVSRQAHDLSRRMGKPLRVELEGGETEMDKGQVEELFEPLLHLVRNALDHGLDTPEERLAAGKPAEGVLKLSAYHQGGEFVLQLSDDGRGFDLESIAAKARAQGRLKPLEEAQPEWLIDLLFQPGFSTAREVTDLSGRGVGLDAVRRRVTDLKGSVRAEGARGKGAVFTLRLPLTMALMEAILVRTRGERYALPASAVLRFLAWDASARHAVGGGESWLEAAGQSLPLVDLGAEGSGRAVAMHVSAGGRDACLVVDEVLGKQQVVVKALGGLLKELPGVAGGAILADGKVGLILDLDSLLKQQALVA